MRSCKIRPDHAMLKIPKYPNLTELAYLQVKQYILEGSLGEGSRLTEELLAGQLGISKSPVREALNRLESDGLVSIEPRRGTYVRKFSLKEACDLYSLRELLEVHAVGLAEITPSFLADLAESIDRIKRENIPSLCCHFSRLPRQDLRSIQGRRSRTRQASHARSHCVLPRQLSTISARGRIK